MERIASAVGTLSQGSGAFRKPRQAIGALLKLLPAIRDWRLSLSQKLTRVFGDNEAVKCALAANLSYYHDDPAALWCVFFAIAQGSYLLSGGRYVQGGSQRLSSALARAIKVAGGEVLLRRVVSDIAPGSQGHSSTVTHTARDGTDAQAVECIRIVCNAAPAALAPLMPAAAAEKLTENDRRHMQSISLFALTLGLSNRDSSDMDAYREKRGRWQQAIVGYLSSFYPGLEDAVVASSFNTALSVRQYLNAPDGAVYGFAPTPPRSIWRVP